jgi:hypothetical protein
MKQMNEIYTAMQNAFYTNKQPFNGNIWLIWVQLK